MFPLLTVLAGCALRAGDSGSQVQYVGGTLAALQSKAEGRISTSDEDALLFRSKGIQLQIPYRQINQLEYGQHVGRRYAEAILISPFLLLSKKRQHFLTVGYMDEEGHQQAMVFRVSKGAIRSVLVSLEARTGRRVEFQDEEARKAGKG